MKKLFFLLFASLFTCSILAQNKTFFDFTVKTVDGENFNLSQLKGKKIMVVNVASHCRFTPQYVQLQRLYEKYKGDNFVIIAFPCNDFGAQEPDSNTEIKEFCTQNYGVTFPVMEKISVKGKDIAPVYKWLTMKSENGKEDAEVTWNFQKFLIDKNGNWVKSFSPQTIPTAKEIVSWIKTK